MNENDLSQGQDSFLDIIANLVGVLIILVVVVGAQASNSAAEQPPVEDHSGEISQLEFDLSRTNSRITRLTIDNEELEQQVDKENIFGKALADRRHAMLVQLAQVRASFDKKLNDADEQQKKIALERARQIELQSQLEAIQDETRAVSAALVKPQLEIETIEHFPNPIAKTVFSDEIHFRLSEGKLAYVPMDELLEMMKSEIRFKAEKLEVASSTRETIGPVSGFWLQYELGVVPSQNPGRNERLIRLKQFVVQPTDPRVGEPIETAMTENSDFSRRLATREPFRTTVSVWVYPDSYEKYTKLKNWLHKQGFQMASWPLSAGKPISGSPDGLRTSAQ